MVTQNFIFPNPRGASPVVVPRIPPSPAIRLGGKDVFFYGAGRGPRYDWPNPRAPRRAQALCGHLNPTPRAILTRRTFQFVLEPPADAGEDPVLRFLPIAIPYEVWPMNQWTVLPRLSSPDNEIDSLVTYTPGTVITGTRHWVFTADGVDIAGTEDALTWLPDATYTGKNIRARSWVGSWGTKLIVVTNELVLLVDSETSLVPTLDPAAFMTDEIRDPADDAGTLGGRARMIYDAGAVVPSGYTVKAYIGPTSGGLIDSATTITPGTTKQRSTSAGAGAVLYFVVWLVNDITGIATPAFAATGTTTAASWDSAVLPAPSGHALSAHPEDAQRGQIAITTLGLWDDGVIEPPPPPLEFTWPQLSASGLSLALASGSDSGSALGKFEDTGGSGSNMVKVLHSGMIGCAYASFAGQTAADSRTLAWFDQLTGTNTMPHCAARPGAARETPVPTFFNLVKRSPLWAGLGATKQGKADLIVRALLYANAYFMSDGNTSPRETIAGYKDPTSLSALPNLSAGPLLTVASCAAYLGLSTAAALLESVDISTFIAEVNAKLGSGSQMGRTWNWSTSSISLTNMYHHGAHSDAPSPSKIEGVLRGWRFQGYPLTNIVRVIMPNDSTGTAAVTGLNRCIPPGINTQGTNLWNYLVWDRPRMNDSYFGSSHYIVIGGREFGLPSGARDAMPHKGDTDCEWAENNGLDS